MKKYLLTDAELRSMTPDTYHDGGGLYCVISSKTSASWHLRYTVKRRPDLGRPKMGLGPYPTVSLARARELADQYRAIAAEGIDPQEHRRQATRRGMTVEQAITELFEKKKHALKGDGKAGRWMSPVANHIIPAIGNVGVADLTTNMIVEKLGKVYVEQPQTGDKVFARLKQALQYASAEDERVNTSIIEDAKTLLPRKKTIKKKRDDGHHPALDWKDVPKLWHSLDRSVVDSALAFYLLTLPRVANVAHMTWADVDLNEGVWNIPPEDIKTGVPFAAPLTRPALGILRRARRFALKDSGDLVFPNPKGRKTRVFHINFLNNRLKRDKWLSTTPGRLAVAHGLRATFSTYMVGERDKDARHVEMSIQHEVMTKQERAYNRAGLLRQRRIILDEWAEYVLSGQEAKRARERRKRLREETVLPDGEILADADARVRADDKDDWLDGGI
ncbi:tyrosine-type recombinase/integrase [Ruegeria arenilitoris]|uniref:Prophage CP4-57 integrase n=1 Tax=Ruegeria arenilitoris TaxID=1173585 RepID=A0A238K0L9_9RHOB|nr:integrase arm-type DNA-binding domain-containing protein [Ruegeria arenilitoris]SMX36458.1 Prophage CP4-57 integrase [Ruegeria arenilitoris]